MAACTRQLVLISGPPAAGKTTLAGPLAAELGFALLAKDKIKETLHDALGRPELGLAKSRRLGAAAMELLWALAADAPAVVLEANFWSGDQRHRDRIAGLAAAPVEVFCQCPAELAAKRYAERAALRHPVHLDGLRGLEPETFARSAVPAGVGPVLTVDTTGPVDVPAVAAAVRAAFASSGADLAGDRILSTEFGVSPI